MSTGVKSMIVPRSSVLLSVRNLLCSRDKTDEPVTIANKLITVV